MIAVDCAQITIEESLSWITCIRRQGVNARVRLRESPCRKNGGDYVCEIEMDDLQGWRCRSCLTSRGLAMFAKLAEEGSFAAAA